MPARIRGLAYSGVIQFPVPRILVLASMVGNLVFADNRTFDKTGRLLNFADFFRDVESFATLR
jgi:hypothetical protein